MYCIYKFSTQNYILFKILASGLFLKYSSNFANLSLDILIKYNLIKKSARPQLKLGKIRPSSLVPLKVERTQRRSTRFILNCKGTLLFIYIYVFLFKNTCISKKVTLKSKITNWEVCTEKKKQTNKQHSIVSVCHTDHWFSIPNSLPAQPGVMLSPFPPILSSQDERSIFLP